MKRMLFSLFVLLLLMVSCGANEMVITGVVSDDEQNPAQVAFVKDSNKVIIDSVEVVNGSFTLTIPCGDEPHFAQLSLVRSKGTKRYDFIVHPCEAEYKMVETHTPSGLVYRMLDNGGYNDQINNDWERCDEMKEKFEAFMEHRVANTAEYFDKQTSMARKMEIRIVYDSLSHVAQNVVNTYLEPQLKSKDVYMRAFAIKKMGVNEYNFEAVPAVVKALGHIDWVAQMDDQYNKFVIKKGRLAKIANGQSVIDVEGVALDGGAMKLSDVYKANKLTMLLFFGNDYDSGKYLPLIEECYEKYKSEGLEIFGVWCKDDLAPLVEGDYPWVLISQLGSNRDEVIDHYMAEYPLDMFFVDSAGVIIEQKVHRYRLESRVDELLN